MKLTACYNTDCKKWNIASTCYCSQWSYVAVRGCDIFQPDPKIPSVPESVGQAIEVLDPEPEININKVLDSLEVGGRKK